MSDSSLSGMEIRRIHRMVRQIARLAEHSSMTGSLSDGARAAVQQYNQIVSYLKQTGFVPGSFFHTLPDETSFDELGVAATLLGGYLEEDAEDARKEDKERRNDRPGPPPPPPAGLKDLEELRAVGELIREHLPELLRRSASPSPQPAPNPQTGER